MGARVTYTLKSATGVEFKIIATGLNYEMAKAEADAKVALSVGKVVSASRSEDVDPSEWQSPDEPSPGSARAIITLARDYSDSKKSIEFTHATGRISDKLRNDGTIDVKHELVRRLAENYRDGEGKGGYRAVSGEFMGRRQKKRKF